MDRKPSLSIVIPAFNEEIRIGATILAVDGYLSRRSYEAEVIVVDDGSTDRTAMVVNELAARIRGVRCLQNKKNRGKGFSVRKGFLNSEGELLFFTDADLSAKIEEVDKLIDWIEIGYDVSVGSRWLEESVIRVHQPYQREIMSRVFNILVQAFVVGGIRDTQCGFKLFKKECGVRIFELQCIDGFAFDVEILYLAKKLGFKIKEVPIVWQNYPRGKFKLLHDAFSMLLDLIRIRLNDIRGVYQ